MATRSNIGIENRDGSIEFVYCHWDGYPENQGPILLNHYNTEEKVRDLISQGSFSGLETSIEKIKYYNDGDGVRKLPTRFEKWDNFEEYLYIFLPETNQWIFSDHGSDFQPLKRG